MEITYHAIGVIHTTFKDLAGMPIQPTSDASGPGTIEVYEPYLEGLKDVDGFSHLIVLYHLHAVQESALLITPFLDSAPRGIFATRAPTRPNPIGLSIVELKGVEGNILHVDQIDVLDGTPLLDLKPYVPEFDHRPDVRIGWLEHARGKVRGKSSDDRFQ